MLVSLIAFNADTVDALLAHAKGDALALGGRGKLTSWEKDGEQRHGLSIVADRVLTAYAAGKARKEGRARYRGSDGVNATSHRPRTACCLRVYRDGGALNLNVSL